MEEQFLNWLKTNTDRNPSWTFDKRCPSVEIENFTLTDSMKCIAFCRKNSIVRCIQEGK